MSKSKLPLSALPQKGKGDAEQVPNQRICEAIGQEVNAQLLQKSKDKFNKLRPCTTCKEINLKLPVLNSPADAKLINTAYNGADGFLAQGERDLNWEVGEGTSGSFPTSWIPAWVFYLNSAWTPSPFSNADWISFYSDGYHDGDRDFYFRYRFYLGNGVKPSQFTLDMDFFADNCVYEIYVNNAPQSVNYPSILPQNATDPYNNRGFDKGKQVHISLSHNWKECENEIMVHVKSGSPYIGFLAQNSFKCYPSKFPDFTPSISISWGDSDCDCLETDDFETMLITICNPYRDVAFNNLIISRIRVTDESGNPVPLLPDGSPSVYIVPAGPFCFGNIAACGNNGQNCVSREFVLFNRGAKSGKYKVVLEGICFDVCKQFSNNSCYEMMLCKS